MTSHRTNSNILIAARQEETFRFTSALSSTIGAFGPIVLDGPPYAHNDRVPPKIRDLFLSGPQVCAAADQLPGYVASHPRVGQSIDRPAASRRRIPRDIPPRRHSGRRLRPYAPLLSIFTFHFSLCTSCHPLSLRERGPRKPWHRSVFPRGNTSSSSSGAADRVFPGKLPQTGELTRKRRWGHARQGKFLAETLEYCQPS